MEIKSLINANYRDVSSVLSKKANWMEMDFLDKKTLNYSRPHSEECFNPLGVASFLFHFKKKDWFNFFPTLMVRDGLLSILHFFYLHPTPEGIKTVFLLPKSAANFIPGPWQDQCLLYQIQTHPLEEKVSRKELFLTTTVNEELYSENYLENVLKIANSANLPLKGLFFRHEPLGEEAVDTNNNHDYSFFKSLHSATKDSIHLTDWRALKTMDLSKSSFLELNENNFWYNDSAVTHHFLSHGANSLNNSYKEEDFSDDDCIRISKYHYYKLSSLTPDHKKKGIENFQYINQIPAHVFAGECLLDRKAQDYKKIFLCTPEFKSMVCDLVNESL